MVNVIIGSARLMHSSCTFRGVFFPLALLEGLGGSAYYCSYMLFEAWDFGSFCLEYACSLVV